MVIRLENKVKEILLILQPRTISEAIESLNKLDIEKVWFRGFTEEELEVHLNDFINNTDYDYYWIIADDVIVDNKPLELLRPLLYEGKVVSGYCLLRNDMDRYNISTEDNLTISHYYEPSFIQYLWKRKRYNLPKGEVELAKSFENAVDNEEDINKIIDNDRNLMIGKRLEDFLSKDEILSQTNDYFTTTFTGWSFTGMPKEVWLNYPFRTAFSGSHTDAQFTIRYVLNNYNEIWTHKDAEHIHLKQESNNTFKQDWIVGIEKPIIHFGNGMINRDEIESECIWWE